MDNKTVSHLRQYLRGLLQKKFSQAELRRLISDKTLLRPLKTDLAELDSLDDMIDKLLDFAERRNRLEYLRQLAESAFEDEGTPPPPPETKPAHSPQNITISDVSGQVAIGDNNVQRQVRSADGEDD